MPIWSLHLTIYFKRGKIYSRIFLISPLIAQVIVLISFSLLTVLLSHLIQSSIHTCLVKLSAKLLTPYIQRSTFKNQHTDTLRRLPDEPPVYAYRHIQTVHAVVQSKKNFAQPLCFGNRVLGCFFSSLFHISFFFYSTFLSIPSTTCE